MRELDQLEGFIEITEAKERVQAVADEVEPILRELAGTNAPYEVSIEIVDVDRMGLVWSCGVVTAPGRTGYGSIMEPRAGRRPGRRGLRRRRSLIALVAAAAMLLTGCSAGTDGGVQASSSPQPSAVQLVRDAQAALLAAGTGHFETAMRRVNQAEGGLPWQHWSGDFDLAARRWRAHVELRDSGDDALMASYDLAASDGVGYMKRLRPTVRGWRRISGPLAATVGGLDATGEQVHVAAVRAFRADGTAPDDDGDTWTVSGTLPMPLALLVVGALVPEASDAAPLLAATGTVDARIVIGQDRTVRELHVAGVDLDVTSGLTDESLRDLPFFTSTITLTRYGTVVSVDPPEAAEVSRPTP